MSFETLFVFPAFYGIVQRSAFVILKKIPDVSIIFKLFSDNSPPLLPVPPDLIISIDCVAVCLSGIGFEPFLKSDIERE